jgi:hypothetical protein
MPIERMTVQQLIERLQAFPPDLPVVVHSYEDGLDPVTEAALIRVTATPDRQWYNGVYEQVQTDGEQAVLIASRYFKKDASE